MKSKKNLWILISIVFMNSIGMSIVLPLLPFMVGKFLPPKQIVIGISLLMSVFAACTFISAPVFGALSDRFGRKIILMLSLLGSAAGYVLFGIGGAFWILLSGRIIDGLTAGNISMLFAYISDSTEPKERTIWFGYISSAMGIGKLGGPALGGMLGSISLSLPFYVTAGLIFLSVLAVFFLLTESLPHEKRTKYLTLSSLNTFVHFNDLLSLREIKLLLLPGILFYIGLTIFQFNFVLFLKDIYLWSPVFIGSVLTVAGICEIFSRALLLPFLLKRFNERSIGLAGLIVSGIGLGLIPASIIIHSAIIIILALLFIITGEGLFDTTYNGKLSQSVDNNKQGKLQGVNQSLQSANNMLVPIGSAALYFFSPAALYAAAALAITLAAFIYAKILSPKDYIKT